MTFYSRNLSWNKAHVFKPNKVGLAFGYFATHNNISAALHTYFQFERRFHTFYTQNVNVVKSPFLDKWKHNWIFPSCDFEEKKINFRKFLFQSFRPLKFPLSGKKLIERFDCVTYWEKFVKKCPCTTVTILISLWVGIFSKFQKAWGLFCDLCEMVTQSQFSPAN